MSRGEVGDTNNEDDFVDGSVIPDAIGIWDIQVRLNDLKRRGGAAAAPANGTSVVKGRRSTRTDQVFSGQKRARNNSSPPYVVWVLVFNDTPQLGAQQGLYCLWAENMNSIVAFEGREGALRYAMELKQQGLGLPSPTRIAMKDLHRFCNGHSYGLKLVPIHVVPVVPDRVKPELGFQAPLDGDGASSSDAGASILTPEDLKRLRDSFERLYLGD